MFEDELFKLIHNEDYSLKLSTSILYLKDSSLLTLNT